MPTVFPIVLSRYHCFSSIFDGLCAIFFALFSHFSPLTLQKVKKLWNWLEIQSQAFFHLFCVFSHIVFPNSLMDFALFFGFVLTFFTSDPAKSQETLKLVADWALLSAAECAAECCLVLLRNSIPSFFPFVLCVFPWFPLFCPEFIVFPFLGMDFGFFSGFVLTFFTPECKKSGNLEISCRLSTAGHFWVLLRNPIPSLFPFVLLKFSLFFVTVFDALVVFCNHFLCFSSCKDSRNLEISCRLSIAEHCWEMQSPAFFHLSCWSFHGCCHRFWWALIRHFLQSFPCFPPWNCEKHSISIALYSLCFSKVLLAVHCLFLIDFVIFLWASFSPLAP